jgi:hypothetical protein
LAGTASCGSHNFTPGAKGIDFASFDFFNLANSLVGRADPLTVMECKNHGGVPAVDRCAGCAEAFCGNCLVEVAGQKYCGSCKVIPIQGKTIVLDGSTTPCKEANEALIFAIISLFCFGFVFGVVAINKAIKARREIDADPSLTGWGKANAAIFVGSLGFLFWIYRIISGAVGGSSHSH